MIDLLAYLRMRQRRNTLILVLAFVAVLAFLVVRGCQNSHTRLAETQRMQHVADSLRDRLRASEIAISNTRATYEARMAATRQERAIAAARADSAGKLLTATQARVKRLLNERVGIIEGPMDEDAGCDSCWAVLPVLSAHVDGFREENTALRELMGHETTLRDSMLAAERRHSDTLQQRADLLSSFKIPKPRNKIYFTLTAITDLTGVGYGGGFTLVTKNDKIWSLKTGVMNRQLFYQVDAGFKLSARKK